MIYLDHAATSFPKPPAVGKAMAHWFERLGVSASRGAGSRCATTATAVDGVRADLAGRLGVPASRVLFTSGATQGLNDALRAVLRPGQRVVTTAFEHAAVARTLRHLEKTGTLRLTVVPPRDDGTLPTTDLLSAVEQQRADWIVFTHASNVTGTVLDAEAICAGARALGAQSVLDVCQTAGLLPVDCGADVTIGSGHKALHGPPGVGFTAVRTDVDWAPIRFGGTGWSPTAGASADQQPNTWPEGLEAGTPNTPAILGLGAAMRWLGEQPGGEARVLSEGLAWAAGLESALLSELGAVTLYRPAPGTPRVPVVSFNIDGLDPVEAGALLDGAGIHVRVGHHCAPWIHGPLGTESAGTIRISPGPGCAPDSIQAVVDALRLG